MGSSHANLRSLFVLLSIVLYSSLSKSQEFQFDLNGNMTVRNGESLTYDGRDQLTSIGGSSQFEYDASGMRVKKTYQGVDTVYLGDTIEIQGCQEKNIVGFAGYPVAATSSSGTQWLHANHLGSVVAVTETDGSIYTQQYSTYGEPAQPLHSPIGYNSQRHDESGLIYLHARYYDPKLGKFLSPDPISNTSHPSGLNPYQYAHNNPIMKADPTGLNPSCESSQKLDPNGTGVIYVSVACQGDTREEVTLGVDTFFKDHGLIAISDTHVSWSTTSSNTTKYEGYKTKVDDKFEDGVPSISNPFPRTESHKVKLSKNEDTKAIQQAGLLPQATFLTADNNNFVLSSGRAAFLMTAGSINYLIGYWKKKDQKDFREINNPQFLDLIGDSPSVDDFKNVLKNELSQGHRVLINTHGSPDLLQLQGNRVISNYELQEIGTNLGGTIFDSSCHSSCRREIWEKIVGPKGTVITLDQDEPHWLMPFSDKVVSDFILGKLSAPGTYSFEIGEVNIINQVYRVGPGN